MSPRLIFGFLAFMIVVFMVGSFIAQIKDESTQMEMAKLGYCKYKQPGLNPPAYFKCKEYSALNE
jgi:hypothetical protein